MSNSSGISESLTGAMVIARPMQKCPPGHCAGICVIYSSRHTLSNKSTKVSGYEYGLLPIRLPLWDFRMELKLDKWVCVGFLYIFILIAVIERSVAVVSGTKMER